MAASWKNLEEYVRTIASLRWASPCRPEHIDGVDIDGVITLPNNQVVYIEITEERRLEKIRADINKLIPVRLSSFNVRQQVPLCYIVMADLPTRSMIEMGKSAGINVVSKEHFESEFFDFRSYKNLRSSRPFGSAVDTDGQNDSRSYVPVEYSEISGNRSLTADRIISSLKENNCIVILGDYGTGKSRLIREIFNATSEETQNIGAFPFAINLRDHWGARNSSEILSGHLGSLGFSQGFDNAMRLLNAGNLLLLLDGFDEIGAQSHDLRIENRRELRKNALAGVRDLINQTKGPVLITGRSHFFDDDGAELLSSLGLSTKRTTVLTAPDSFSPSEADIYLSKIGIKCKTPEWLPRKPLIFQLIAELPAEDVEKILSRETGSFEFWGRFIHAITTRESLGVKGSITPSAIRDILITLAGISRHSDQFMGHFSPSEINKAYEKVLGSTPDPTGAQLLSRMCTLGRKDPETPNRQFIDANIVDVLRAEHLVLNIANLSPTETEKPWRQALRPIGLLHAASGIEYWGLSQYCHSFLRKYATCRNQKILGEAVSVLSVISETALDFHSISLTNSNLPMLFFDNKTVNNLSIKNSEIGLLLLSPHVKHINLSVASCFVDQISGASGKAGLPTWIIDTEAVTYENSTSNSSQIKSSSIPAGQKILLAITHKIFFQKGSGREEGALYKGGYGHSETKFVQDILKKLMKEGIITSHKGDKGVVYSPVYKHLERMSKLKHEVTLSEDPLWTWAGTLK